jgi:hypothetical protein
MFSHSSGHPRCRPRPAARRAAPCGGRGRRRHVVPDMTAVAVPGQGVAVQRVQQAERDQLLRLLARRVVVRAAADHRLDPERGSVRETSRSPAASPASCPCRMRSCSSSAAPCSRLFRRGRGGARPPRSCPWSSCRRSSTPRRSTRTSGDLRAHLRGLTLNAVRLVLATMRAGLGRTRSARTCRGKRLSASGRSSRRPTRSPRRRSCGASTPAPHGQRNRRQGPLQRRHRAGGPPCRGDGRKLLARRGRLGVRPLSGRRLAIGVAVGPIAAEIR